MLHSQIILMCAMFALASSESYFIAPTNSSDCVVDECMTIKQFFMETNISSNITLFFLEGNHVVDFKFVVSNSTQFHMLPFDNTEESYNVSITCDIARFVFINVSTIDIIGITFVDCEGTEFESIDELSIAATTFTGRDTSLSTLSITSSVARLTDTQLTLVASIFGIILDTARYGGAILVTNSSLDIDSCVFMGNVARVGGAISSRMDSEIIILNSDFISNRAVGRYGILHSGGAIYVDGTSTIVVSNSTFENNTSHLG